jgi:hypothetical protein
LISTKLEGLTAKRMPDGGTCAHGIADPARRRALSGTAVRTRGAVVVWPTATPPWARCAAMCTSSTGVVGRTRRARPRPQEFSKDAGRRGGWRKHTGAAVVRSPDAPRRPRWPEAGGLSSHMLGRRSQAASQWRGCFGEARHRKEVAWWLGAMAAAGFGGPAHSGANRGSRCGGGHDVDGTNSSVAAKVSTRPVRPG